MKIALLSLKMGWGGKVVNFVTEFNYFIVLYSLFWNWHRKSVIEHFVLMHIDMVTFRAAVTAKKFGVNEWKFPAFSL